MTLDRLDGVGGGHEVGWQRSGTWQWRPPFYLPRFRFFCNTCGATGAWSPWRADAAREGREHLTATW